MQKSQPMMSHVPKKKKKERKNKKEGQSAPDARFRSSLWDRLEGHFTGMLLIWTRMVGTWIYNAGFGARPSITACLLPLLRPLPRPPG